MCADCVLTFQAENTCEDFMGAMMTVGDQPPNFVDWVDFSCMQCIESIYAVCMGFSNGPDCN